MNEDVDAGVSALLDDCMALQKGDVVLMLREPANLNWYKEDLIDFIVSSIRDRGAIVRLMSVPIVPEPDHLPSYVLKEMESVEHVLFLSRTGDQIRFAALPGSGTRTICYAKTLEFLGSEACRTSQFFLSSVLKQVQSVLDRSVEWHVSCTAGTDIRGRSSRLVRSEERPMNFTAKLFPAGVFRALPCENATGQIVTRWFPPVFTHRYEPFGLSTPEPVTLVVEAGGIVDILGPLRSVERVKEHYNHVGRLYGKPARVSSWHCGINAKVNAPCDANDDLELWGGTMHLSSRWAHFHTCGDVLPGEINAVVLDPTITIDGQFLWRAGVLQTERVAEMDQCFDRFGVSKNWFAEAGRLGV